MFPKSVWWMLNLMRLPDRNLSVCAGSVTYCPMISTATPGRPLRTAVPLWRNCRGARACQVFQSIAGLPHPLSSTAHSAIPPGPYSFLAADPLNGSGRVAAHLRLGETQAREPPMRSPCSPSAWPATAPSRSPACRRPGGAGSVRLDLCHHLDACQAALDSQGAQSTGVLRLGDRVRP